MNLSTGKMEMKNQLITKDTTFTVSLFTVVHFLLSLLQLNNCRRLETLFLNNPAACFSNYPPVLPSIYLFNLKQTKIFAFILD